MRRALLTVGVVGPPPTPAYVSSNAAGVAGGTADITITTPAGSTGDRLFVFCCNNNVTATWAELTTTDFSSIGTPASGSAAFTRLTDGSEAGSYTFRRSVNTTAAALAVMVRVSSAGTVQDTALTNGSGASLALTGVTAAASNYLLQIAAKVVTGAATWTEPGTAVERADASSSGTSLVYAIGDEFVGAGATGTRTWTQTGTGGTRGVVIAINPV